METKCGIKHGFGDQTCIREIGHPGPCRSRAFRGTGGTITYSEWYSRDGKFYDHLRYETIYPANAARDGQERVE
jgi:hypothetical protein